MLININIKRVNTINLRGHHIEALAERYAQKRGLYKEETKPLSNSARALEKSYERYREKFGVDAYNKLKAKLDKELQSSYAGKIMRGIKEKEQALTPLFDSWLSNSDLEVRVTYGHDSACQACPQNNSCSNESNPINDKQDRTPLLEYDIAKNKPYKIRELIEIFKGHIDRTGFPSPRTKNEFKGKTS